MDRDYNIDNLTEDEAVTLYHKLAAKFGWAGTFFTRNDVASIVDEDTETITDEEFDRIRSTWAWKNGITEILTERGWELVDDAIRDADLEIKEPDEYVPGIVVHTKTVGDIFPLRQPEPKD